MPYLSTKLSGVCKHCGFEFKSVRSHLKYSPECRVKYGSDNDPEYILSGPCRSCGKVFRHIRCHLSHAPQCVDAYDWSELDEASKQARRMYEKSYYAANEKKINKNKKAHYQDNRESIIKRVKAYQAENKDRIYAVKKWKLTH